MVVLLDRRKRDPRALEFQTSGSCKEIQMFRGFEIHLGLEIQNDLEVQKDLNAKDPERS